MSNLARGRLPKAKKGWRLRHLGSMAGLQRGEQAAAEASDCAVLVGEGVEVLVACVGAVPRPESASLETRSEPPLAEAEAATPRPLGFSGKRKSFLGAGGVPSDAAACSESGAACVAREEGAPCGAEAWAMRRRCS